MKIEKAIQVCTYVQTMCLSDEIKDAMGMAIDALKEVLQRDTKPEKEHIGFEEDEIFLLSKEEYEKYKDKIPAINCWWWLRSHGSDYSSADYVYRDGSAQSRGCYVVDSSGAVRPVLKLKGEYDVGARIVLNAFPWVVIDKSLAIAEVPIAFTAFNDNDNNSYRDSDVRAYLKKWLEDRRKDDVTITPKEFKERMAHIAEIDDEETRHGEMDDFMVEVLNQLGYEEGTKIFEDVEKWYS